MTKTVTVILLILAAASGASSVPSDESAPPSLPALQGHAVVVAHLM